jgi:hypothetical protein
MNETRRSETADTGRIKPAPSSRRVRKATEPVAVVPGTGFPAQPRRAGRVRLAKVAAAKDKVSEAGYDVEAEFRTAIEILIDREL